MANEVVWHEDGMAELRAKIAKDVDRRCLLVEAAAKRIVHVDTGRLRASITHETEVQGDEVVGRIGSNVEYAMYHEYDFPYLRPSLAAGAGGV